MKKVPYIAGQWACWGGKSITVECVTMTNTAGFFSLQPLLILLFVVLLICSRILRTFAARGFVITVAPQLVHEWIPKPLPPHLPDTHTITICLSPSRVVVIVSVWQSVLNSSSCGCLSWSSIHRLLKLSISIVFIFPSNKFFMLCFAAYLTITSMSGLKKKQTN